MNSEENKIMVSISCITYNQEMYIRDALEGFIKQKTNFNYEVVVHDDASTDKTPEIIREYAKKYPDIIKPIFQEENQYSKGVQISKTYVYPVLKGKYIAECEGDDYWIDENKLQKQVDFLESHPDYSACAHSSIILNCKDGTQKVDYEVKEDCTLELQDIFDWKEKRYQSASLMFRAEYMDRPKEFHMRNVGDLPLGIYLGINGKIFFFKEPMSVYRAQASGAWSVQYNGESIKKREEVCREIGFMLKEIDEYTKGEFHECIQLSQHRREFDLCILKGDYRSAVKNHRVIYKQYPIKIQIGFWMRAYIPHIYGTYEKRKGKIGNGKSNT